MERVCGINSNYCSCPFLGENSKCNAPMSSKCCYIVKLLDKPEEVKKYERAERWYEKYYKR